MNASRYLYRDCALLAVAVRRLTGWPLVEIMYPYHVLARCPDGRLLDAAGMHDPRCLDGFSWREADAAFLAAGHGRRAAAPDVVADARELLAAWPPGRDEATPLPWSPPPRSVSSSDLGSCGLVPACLPD